MIELIRQLSEDTIQKIAAGEVIERPVSVVKELVENSIDSNSDNIIVEIKKAGKDYISVSDNGTGIEENEVELALKRHSTSKLRDFNDLYKIHSLGFRGEALASILAISKLTINTKTDTSEIGISHSYHDSKLVSKKNIVMNRGTKIIVKDLFYNVPVRKNFLKSDQTEANLITNIMYKFAIGNPKISFTYIKDDRTIFQTKANSTIKDNVINLFGTDLSNNLLEINISKKDYKVYGYISNNSLYRANRQMQYIFLNGRYIKNDYMRKSIENSYNSVIPNGRYPVYQLFFEIKPKLIDVNIHPNKEKVKISILDEILEDLKNSIEKLLRENVNINNFSSNNLSKSYTDDKYKDLRKKYFSYDNNSQVHDGAVAYSLNNDNSSIYKFMDKKPSYEYENTSNSFLKDKVIDKTKNENLAKNKPLVKQEELSKKARFSSFKYLTSLFNTYLVMQDESDYRVYIFDQHACHERVSYEKLLKQFNDDKVVSQSLLFPKNIYLNDDLMYTYSKYSDLLTRLGFDISEFSDDSILVRAVPYIFGDNPQSQLLLDILYTINEDDKKALDVIEKDLIKKSCKMSVKAGDKLSILEINELLKDLFSCQYPYTCPHGRPTFVEIKENDLEKIFMRQK